MTNAGSQSRLVLRVEDKLFIVLDLVVLAGLVAAVATAGWAAGQAVGERLGVKAIIVTGAATVAVLGVAFFVVDSGPSGDANIGAGLVLIVLVGVLVATPSAVVSARRQPHE